MKKWISNTVNNVNTPPNAKAKGMDIRLFKITDDKGYSVIEIPTEEHAGKLDEFCKSALSQLNEAYTEEVLNCPDLLTLDNLAPNDSVLGAWYAELKMRMEDKISTSGDLQLLARGMKECLAADELDDKCPKLSKVLDSIVKYGEDNAQETPGLVNYLYDKAITLARINIYICASLTDSKLPKTPEVKAFNAALIELFKHLISNDSTQEQLKCIDALQKTLPKDISAEWISVGNNYIIKNILTDLKARVEKEAANQAASASGAAYSAANGQTQTPDAAASPSAQSGQTQTPDAAASPSAQSGQTQTAADKEAAAKAAKDAKVGIEQETPSGLKFTVTQAGSGKACKTGDLIRVHYIGTFQDGTKFDSSYDRGEPLQFALGKGIVIDGWESGIPGMKVGEKRHLIVPPALAYGKDGNGPIPPDTTLEFDIELVGVN